MYVFPGIPNGEVDGTRVIGDSNSWVISTLGSVTSIVFLAILVTCACCVKRKPSVERSMGDDEMGDHPTGKDANVRQDPIKPQAQQASTQAPPQEAKQSAALAIKTPVQNTVTPPKLPDSMGKSLGPPIPEPPIQDQTPQLPIPVTTTNLKTSMTPEANTGLQAPMVTSAPAPGKKAVEVTPKQAPVPPPTTPPTAGTARFDDPAYRTMGLDLDLDPFAGSADELPPLKVHPSINVAKTSGKSQAVPTVVTNRDAALANALLNTLKAVKTVKTATAGTVAV